MKRECLEREPCRAHLHRLLHCLVSGTVSVRRRGQWGEGSDVFVPISLGSPWSSQLPARVLGQVFQALSLLPCFSLFCCLVFPFPSLQAVLKAKKKKNYSSRNPPSRLPFCLSFGEYKFGETDTQQFLSLSEKYMPIKFPVIYVCLI